MTVGIKDIFKLTGMIIISACAVFVSMMFLNYNADLKSIEALITDAPTRALYDALVMSGTVVSAVSGGCLLLTSAVMLCFYIKHYIDAHRKELGILKALGFSKLRIAVGFRVFGLSVFTGSALGSAAAYCVMPTFYAVQNKEGLLPEFGVGFHPELMLCLVILPTAFFAAMSVLYGVFRLRAPALELLRGRSAVKVKYDRSDKERPFLREVKRSVIRSRKSLVFFIGFAAFCFSAMVQMSLGMDGLADEMMAYMMLGIGLTLAFVTLFIALTVAVRSNAKTISMMKAFGYSRRDCSSSVLNGYRPAAAVGFVVGTVYQYVLLKIAVNVIFADVENVPEVEFDLKALIVTAAAFVAVYETVMYAYSRRIGKISVKEIMADCE